MFKIVSVAFSIYVLNLYISFQYTPIVLFIFLLFHIMSKFNKIWVVWATSLTVILVSTIIDLTRFSSEHDHYYYCFQIISYWNLLRLTSYFIDIIKEEEKYSAIDAFCYVFYLPLLFGPYIRYQDFKRIYLPSTQPLSERCRSLVKGLARFSFWSFFINLAQHYVYVSAIVYHPTVR